MLFAQVDRNLARHGSSATETLQAIPYLHDSFPANDNRAGGSSKERDGPLNHAERYKDTCLHVIYLMTFLIMLQKNRFELQII